MSSTNGSIEQVLKEFVANRVALPEPERKANVAYADKLVKERLVPMMRSLDPLFDAIFEKISYTGSYYENLKVARTNEFDLNLVLRLPFKLKSTKINNKNKKPKRRYRNFNSPQTMFARQNAPSMSAASFESQAMRTDNLCSSEDSDDEQDYIGGTVGNRNPTEHDAQKMQAFYQRQEATRARMLALSSAAKIPTGQPKHSVTNISNQFSRQLNLTESAAPVAPVAPVASRMPKSKHKRRGRRAQENFGSYKIVIDDDSEGFAQLKLGQSLKESAKLKGNSKYKDLARLFDDETCTLLSAEKMNEWMQSVVDRALHELNVDDPNGDARLTRSRSGPAITLNIVKKNGTRIDVDLVPVVRLHPSILEQIATGGNLFRVPKDKREAFLVPKLLQPQKETYFRVSVPIAERHLLLDKNCAKTLIRIFKAIRDIENWSIVSYQIKTLFLWKLIEKPRASDWQEGQLVQLFREMLEKFRNTMIDRRLPHIFFPGFNMLNDMTLKEAEPIARRLDHFIDLVNQKKSTELDKILNIRIPASWSQ